MTSNAAIPNDITRPESFQLKGALFPMTLLELRSGSMADIKKELEQKIKQSPEFFNHSPVVFGFDQLGEAEQKLIDIAALIALARSLNLMPAATRGGNDAIVKCQSLQLGLAHIPRGRLKAVETNIAPGASEDAAQPNGDNSTSSTETKAASHSAKNTAKVISHPVRSGQQVYAPDGDLIILSSVSPGAEVIAEGNIHIYGTLRGKALAGVQGDQCARIFCGRQEAELVSIAGEYLVGDTLRQSHWQQSVQIFFEQGNLTIQSFA